MYNFVHFGQFCTIFLKNVQNFSKCHRKCTKIEKNFFSNFLPQKLSECPQNPKKCKKTPFWAQYLKKFFFYKNHENFQSATQNVQKFKIFNFWFLCSKTIFYVLSTLKMVRKHYSEAKFGKKKFSKKLEIFVSAILNKKN